MKKRILSCLCVLLFVTVLLFVHGYFRPEKIKNGKEVMQEEKEQQKEQKVTAKEDVVEEISPLEKFGNYVEQLYTKGRMSDLENYIISENLSLQEAALLAEKSSLFEHLKMYEQNHDTVSTRGIRVIKADVDKDGIEDIIEYGPREGNYFLQKPEQETNKLIIYKGEVDGTYTLLYSQPLCDIKCSNELCVIRYEEENFLLFQTGEKGGTPEFNKGYWLSEGIPGGKMELVQEYQDVKAKVIDKKDGYDAGYLIEEILIKKDYGETPYYEEGILNFYKMEYLWESPDWNSEKLTTVEQDEDNLYRKFKDEYISKIKYYKEEYGWKIKSDYCPVIEDVYEADINNDGILERYVKTNKVLALVEPLDTIGRTEKSGMSGRRVVTELYYGRHAGRSGLLYYMETDGQKTDFEKLCGLDIWEGELTPQWFFVRATDMGNVVHIIYWDKNAYEQRIDGYLIEGDKYERVVSVSYIPEITCSVNYEYRKEGEDNNISYFTYLSADTRSVEIKWGVERPLEKTINQNIRDIISKKIEETEKDEDKEFSMVDRYTVSATEETYVMEYAVLYIDDGWKTFSNNYFMEVDLTTGECREIPREEIKEPQLRW